MKIKKITVDADAPPANCPECNSTNVMHIRYGKMAPSECVNGLPVRNGCVIGGCVIGPDAPTWICVDCKNTGGHREYKIKE